MALREKRPTRNAPSPYKYSGYMDEDMRWHSPLEQCEEIGQHRVTPKTWPPPRTKTMTAEDPSLNARCELCGVWLIVYDGHATGQLQGIDIVLNEEQKKRTRVAS